MRQPVWTLSRRTAPLALAVAAATTLAAGPLACGSETDGELSPGLPPEDGGDGGDGGTTDGGGTGGGTTWTGGGTGAGPEPGDDESPLHQLTLLQEGSWTLSPSTPPYESMTGTLVLTELLDGDEAVPFCTATFALTGVATAERCEGCTAGFEVLHYLSEDGASLPGGEGQEDTLIPGLAGCLGTDLPAHEEVWAMALATDRIERRLGTSTWLPWYEAEVDGGSVSFEWTATVAVELDDEEESQ